MYIGVEDPLAHRKNLLMCSKDMITSLKNFERLKSIRKDKIESIFELRRVVEEIIVLNRKIRQHMPKSDIPVQKADSRRQLKKTKVESTPQSKADLLQKELDRIENKLSRLS